MSFSGEMDTTGNYPIKWNDSDSETQTAQILIFGSWILWKYMIHKWVDMEQKGGREAFSGNK